MVFNEEIYDDIALATGKVDFVYGLCLPTTASGVGHSNPCTGRADAFSQSTEEYAGSTTFTQLAEILSSNVPDYFYNKIRMDHGHVYVNVIFFWIILTKGH